jgi:hypothetical protein
MSKFTLTTWAIVVAVIVAALCVGIVLGFALCLRVPPIPSAPVEMAEPTPTDWLPPGGTFTPQPASTSECATPNATLICIATSVAPRLAVVETAVERFWDAGDAVAIALGILLEQPTPLATYTPGPSLTPGPEQTEPPTATPTSEFLPTVTPVPTPAPLCHSCGASDRTYNCPSGWWCKEIRSGMWRCVSNESPAADAQKCLAAAMETMPVGSPEWSMTGLAVYHNEQRETASGEPWDGNAMAGAVDGSIFSTLRGQVTRICNIPGYGVNEARCIQVRINDKGPLAEQGAFVYESRPRGMLTVTRWWEGDGDGALPIVVDLTAAAMDVLTNNTRETCAITMEVLE